jgi:hypothetical protein
MRRACQIFMISGLLLAVTSLRAEVVMPLAAMSSSIGHVDVTLDLPKDVPYTGEMIMLHVRSTIRGFVALDELRQPPLTNFNWQQLGRDKPIHVMVDGFDVPGIERNIAVFPQQPGRLIIDPFVRHVTMIVGENQRVEVDFASKPVFVDVQRHEGLGRADEWWLPSSAVTYRESWSPEPDQIEPGKVARRILIIEAAGITADRLPPPPLLRAPGIITFTGPVNRETVLTANGPVARATYQWDMRPVSGSPALLPAIHIPWFDTRERRMRDLAIPEHWVSYAGTLIGSHAKTGAPLGARLLASGPLAAGGAGFLWALSLGFLAVSARSGRGAWTALWKSPEVRALLRAARQGKPEAVKGALVDLARSNPVLWQSLERDPALASRLAQLDAALYGQKPLTAPPLVPLARDISRLWQAAAGAQVQQRDADDGLPPVDGVFRAPPGLWNRLTKISRREN